MLGHSKWRKSVATHVDRFCLKHFCNDKGKLLNPKSNAKSKSIGRSLKFAQYLECNNQSSPILKLQRKAGLRDELVSFVTGFTSIPQYAVSEAVSQIARLCTPQPQDSATDIPQMWNFFYTSSRRRKESALTSIEEAKISGDADKAWLIFVLENARGYSASESRTEARHSSEFRHRLPDWPSKVLPHPRGWNSSWRNLKPIQISTIMDEHHRGKILSLQITLLSGEF